MCIRDSHAEVPANEDVLALHDEIDNVEKELREKLSAVVLAEYERTLAEDGGGTPAA